MVPALTINKVPNWEKILSKHQGISVLRRSHKRKDVKPSTDKRKWKLLALQQQETPAYKQASRVDQESDSNGDMTSTEDDPLPKRPPRLSTSRSADHPELNPVDSQ